MIGRKPAPNLGVRWSILRKQPGGEFAEVGPETVLDSGEAVRLKLVPNNHGRLSVWEAGPNSAWRPIGSGPAEPLQPFETPLAGAEGPGPRQLYVLFTRSAGVGGLQTPSLLTQARTNLTQTSADVAEKATYVVNRVSDPSAGPLIVPITIQYK